MLGIIATLPPNCLSHIYELADINETPSTPTEELAQRIWNEKEKWWEGLVDADIETFQAVDISIKTIAKVKSAAIHREMDHVQFECASTSEELKKLNNEAHIATAAVHIDRIQFILARLQVVQARNKVLENCTRNLCSRIQSLQERLYISQKRINDAKKSCLCTKNAIETLNAMARNATGNKRRRPCIIL